MLDVWKAAPHSQQDITSKIQVLYRHYQANFHIYNIFTTNPLSLPAPAHTWTLHRHTKVRSQCWEHSWGSAHCQLRATAGFGSGSTSPAQPSLSCTPVTPQPAGQRCWATESTTAGGVQSSNLNHLCPVNITMKSRYCPRAKPECPPTPHQLLCTGLTKISVTIQRPKGYLLSIYYNFFLAGFSMQLY